MTSNAPALSADLLDAIRPLQRQLAAQRSLSAGKFGILRRLTETTRATTGELAGRIQVSPQAVSLSTRELEELGLIVRERDDEDRRRVWFVLTEAGRTRYEQEHVAGRAWLAEALDQHLTGAEQRRLAAAVPLLNKLTEGPNA